MPAAKAVWMRFQGQLVAIIVALGPFVVAPRSAERALTLSFASRELLDDDVERRVLRRALARASDHYLDLP
jgi:hypothetical protein